MLVFALKWLAPTLILEYLSLGESASLGEQGGEGLGGQDGGGERGVSKRVIWSKRVRGKWPKIWTLTEIIMLHMKPTPAVVGREQARVAAVNRIKHQHGINRLVKILRDWNPRLYTSNKGLH